MYININNLKKCETLDSGMCVWKLFNPDLAASGLANVVIKWLFPEQSPACGTSELSYTTVRTELRKDNAEFREIVLFDLFLSRVAITGRSDRFRATLNRPAKSSSVGIVRQAAPSIPLTLPQNCSALLSRHYSLRGLISCPVGERLNSCPVKNLTVWNRRYT